MAAAALKTPNRLSAYVHHVLRHAGSQLPLQLFQVAGDCPVRTDLLVQEVFLLRELLQHDEGALTNLDRLFALCLLQLIVLVERSQADTQIALQEHIGIVRCDHVTVLGDKAVCQARSWDGRAHRQHFVDRFGGLVDEADFCRVVGNGGPGGDFFRDGAHQCLDFGGEWRVRVRGVEGHGITVHIVVALEQVLGHVHASASTLPIEQLADRGECGGDGFRVAGGFFRVVDDGAHHAHDQFTLLIVQGDPGVLQGLPGQVSHEGRLVAHIGIA